MNNEKQFYLDCLKDGKQRHDKVYNKMKSKFAVSATVIRDMLIADGYIREAGQICRNDGKNVKFYELTGKKFKVNNKKEESSGKWEDGSIKSQGNAFDWRNFSRGLYTQSELAAAENGRKWGANTASKQILPRVSI